MAQARYYSATAEPTVLTAGITSGSTVINVMATTGFPASTPFILALDYNTPSEEIVLVTVQAGTNLTVTRAYDGTSATSHNAGAGVRHTWTAMDGNDSRAHEAASTGVHGINIASSVVGTIDSQTLANKTLTSPTISGTVSGTATFSNQPTFSAGLLAGGGTQFQVDASGNMAANNVNTGTYTTYVPVWGSSGTAPVIGNGTVSGRYQKVGKTIKLLITWIAGSTTTFGTGEWTFSLPVAALNIGPTTSYWTGSTLAINPGTAYYPGTSQIESAASVVRLLSVTSATGSTNSRWTNTVPVTWGNGYNLSISIDYETA